MHKAYSHGRVCGASLHCGDFCIAALTQMLPPLTTKSEHSSTCSYVYGKCWKAYLYKHTLNAPTNHDPGTTDILSSLYIPTKQNVEKKMFSIQGQGTGGWSISFVTKSVWMAGLEFFGILAMQEGDGLRELLSWLL